MNKDEISQPAAFLLPFPAHASIEREESNDSPPLLAMPIPDDGSAADAYIASSTVECQDPSNKPASPGGKKKRKKAPKGSFRKAPQAPRRFRSPYILFSMSRMEEYKRGKGTTNVTAISRLVAGEWKALSPVDRKNWDQVADQDKARYNAEKSLYTGPWQVPSKRSKKDPRAPKRPPSAFLFYCQTQRPKLKKERPDLRNTELSVLLGQQWKAAPPEVRQPLVAREKREREIYKARIADWRNHRKAEETFQKQHRLSVAEQFVRTGGAFCFPRPGVPWMMPPRMTMPIMMNAPAPATPAIKARPWNEMPPNQMPFSPMPSYPQSSFPPTPAKQGRQQDSLVEPTTPVDPGDEGA